MFYTMSTASSTQWTELGIRCPACGNNGQSGSGWERNASLPFKLLEDITRSFEFTAEVASDGRLRLIADVDTDSAGWKSGQNTRLECMQCFGTVDLRENADYDFE